MYSATSRCACARATAAASRSSASTTSRGAPVARRASRGPDLYAAGRGLDVEVPRILLAHQPRYFKEAAGRVALQLSGHTHGGQINPGFRPADLVMDFVAGRYERDGSTLWVNRGFGVAGPPSRVGAPPEVTKIVIVARRDQPLGACCTMKSIDG